MLCIFAFNNCFEETNWRRIACFRCGSMLGGVAGRHMSNRRRGSTPNAAALKSALSGTSVDWHQGGTNQGSTPLSSRRQSTVLTTSLSGQANCPGGAASPGLPSARGSLQQRHVRLSIPEVVPSSSPRYRRRRAVTDSDQKTCALVQSRLKLGDIM